MKALSLLFFVLAVVMMPVASAASLNTDTTPQDHVYGVTMGPVTVSIGDGSLSGTVVFLFGAFCALWAQNTNRNPWLWFFLGVFLNMIAVLVVLAKNNKGKPVEIQPHPKLNLS